MIIEKYNFMDMIYIFWQISFEGYSLYAIQPLLSNLEKIFLNKASQIQHNCDAPRLLGAFGHDITVTFCRVCLDLYVVALTHFRPDIIWFVFSILWQMMIPQRSIPMFKIRAGGRGR
ncbi:hypothetical protein ACJX0J_037147, partial [Zea mays]